MTLAWPTNPGLLELKHQKQKTTNNWPFPEYSKVQEYKTKSRIFYGLLNFNFNSSVHIVRPAAVGWRDLNIITLVTGQTICLPADYVKFELPPETPTYVSIGVDIKDIPKVSDKDFSVTLNAYFIVKWRDPRIIVSDARNLSESAGQQDKSQTANRNIIKILF